MKKIPIEALAQHVIVLGKTRSGKSSVMRIQVERLLDEKKPVCIIDPKGDWWGIKSSANGKGPGFPVVIFGGDHADVPINAHAGAQVAELVATGNRPCLIDLGGWTVADRTRFYIEFASTLFRTTRGMRWLVIDECHNFAPQGKIMDPEAGKMLHWSNRLASEGLGKGLQIIAASQRPQKVHKDFVTSCETLIAMKVIHPLDRNQIKDWIDGCPDADKGREVVSDLAQMPRGTGWVWSPEIGFGPVKIAFPMFSTYDSFKPQHGEAVKLKGWATVDLDEVRTKLADALKESEANDPKRLRQRIAELERDAKKGHAAPQIDAGAIAVAEQRGHQEGHAAGYAAGYREAAESAALAAHELADEINSKAGNPQGYKKPVVKHNDQFAKKRKLASLHIPQSTPKRLTPVAGATGMSKAERLILTALAQYPQGRTKKQVAVLTNYAVNGGGFNNAIGALRSRNCIDGDKGCLVITSSGLESLGPFDPLPHGDALLQTWLRQLGKAERLILQVLVAAYPDELTKDQIAERCDPPYAANGGGFNNALGRLRSLELISGSGNIVASENLFG